MLNKEALQKKYFQLIMPGHYIDVQTVDSEWKVAKVIDKDKRYVYVIYDGWLNKEDQFFINSFRVSPLRANTQGFTGSYLKVSRNNMPKIQDLKNYIQVAQEKFFNQQKANAFQITQMLRGQLFVYVHDLICKQYTLSQDQIKETNVFLYMFIDLVLKTLDKALEFKQEYFNAPLAINKLFYLHNSKIAIVESLQQLLILLQFLLKVQTYKFATLFKYNKTVITQEKLAQYFMERKGLIKLYQIFVSNDKNGKWYPSSVRKLIYKIMLKYSVSKLDFVLPKLPKYFIRDFQEFYSIYPFMFKYSPQIEFQSQYVDFSINILLSNSPFDAKLKSILEIKKILQGKNQLQFLDKNKVIAKIDQMQVLQKLLQNKSFNPQVFKRFVPILSILCKVKSLNLKHIHALFEIIKHRHESQTGIIFAIISQICEFAPSSLLDNVYTEICKIDINSQQTINFIKTFTVKAIENLSKQKSYFSGWFGKKKGSSKHGYYGLNILYKESHDDGRITRQKILFALNVIKQILAEGSFTEEKWSFIISCVDSIKKKKNFGQSIKLINLILTTYQDNSYFTQDRKKIVEKLDSKYNVVDLIFQGFKSIENIVQTKVTHEQCFQYFYDLIELFSSYLKIPLKVKHIEYLWYKCDNGPLLNFLKKSKPNQKIKKMIPAEIIEQIFNVIFKKASFYKRPLLFNQFQTIYELFISYHVQKQNIILNIKDGLVRYNKSNLLGLQYFISFLQYTNDIQNFQKATKKSIDLVLRPNSIKSNNLQQFLLQKISVWKHFFKLCIEKLFTDPKKCLLFIQYFYSLIQGRLYKEIASNDTLNLQILVQFDDQQKIISIQRFSTIFRLRKLIKEKFRITNDFNMFNVKLKKIITFQQEEDFSVNAMPTVENGKGVTIKIELLQNKLHQQERSCHFFKQQIQKQQKLYELIFKIIQDKNLSTEIEKQFWKTIELLPLNKSMMIEIQKCDNFAIKKWQKYLQVSSQSSLQYKLNIILNLIKGSENWVLKMQKTGGLLAIIQNLLKKLSLWKYKFQNETLCLKTLQIIQKCYQKCPKKQIPLNMIKEVNISILNTLNNQFNYQQSNKQQITETAQALPTKNRISLMLVNKALQIYLSNLKILMNSNQAEIPLMKKQTFIAILDYALYLKKSQSTQKFAQQVSISLNFALFEKPEDRVFILEYLIQNLSLSNLMIRQRSQNYFKFLITVLYSFEQQKKEIQQKSQNFYEEKLSIIWKFVNALIQQQNFKDQQKQTEQIIFGALSLLKFLLSKNSETLQKHLKQVYQKILDFFIFPISQEYSKRLKTQKNKKVLFQILKKISFQNPEFIQLIINKLSSFLQRNKFRKNTIMSWNLHFENSQKKNFVGLQNLGATCYINCLFQQLFMIKYFREAFISIDSRNYRQSLEKNEVYQLQKLFFSLKYNNRKSETTSKFCSSFITFEGEPINPVVQSDADQFYNTLMQRIQTFFKTTGKHDILENTFQGKLSNQLICQGCPHRSQKFQSFMSIGVNLKNKKTLQQALKGFSQGEILDGDNAYFCQICQKKVRTVKRLCIKQLPNILVIVLKRFEYNFDTYKKIKINSFLQFPEKLNMTEYTAEHIESKSLEVLQGVNVEQNQKINKKLQNSNVFQLRGTVIHAGNADAGHYYSFIKQNKKWYEFNDEYVTQIKYSKIQQEGFGGDQKQVDDFKMEKYKNAYILFYQRQQINQQKIMQKPESTQSVDLKMCQQQSQQVKDPLPVDKNFYCYMADKVLEQNEEVNILSSLLQPNFIHFWQNLSILENLNVKKFIMLYFHTVILRDKLKYEYASNYFRIIIKYLSSNTINKENNQENNQKKKNQLAEWFLNQINKSYVKQFLIQAPKTIRLICVSLVITAIHYSEVIPQSLPLILISCLRRNGMSPFGLILKKLSTKKDAFQKLKQLNYQKIVLSLLLNQKKLQQLDIPQSQQQIQKYFGTDCSEFQAQKQKCSSALLQSLQQFDNLNIQSILKLNESFSFRKTNKILLKKLAQIICSEIQSGDKNQDDVSAMIRMFEEKISTSNYGKQFVQKYLFFMRFLILQCSNCKLKSKIYEIIILSFENFIVTSSRFYEPMDWLMREFTKISSKNAEIKNIWKKNLLMKSNVKLQIETWLKQVEKPQYLNTKDDFFQRTRQMNIQQKTQYLKKYSKKMRSMINWMFEDNEIPQKLQQSDFDQVGENQTIQVRNKAFKIRQKFQKSIIYLVSYEDKQDSSYWAFLQKNQIQIFSNL